ncbi:hypothetical protein BC938DRAFT_470792 [Jimgerdemannia flammicorona]|uniref:Palmitoyltransferase n=1 Tax=Jimgerdemannia flammicorona TaxID=994334 RepID=A0A433Q9E9_9FUNG|nr:hypothetical protein BC938DRAFT_470792 [Jimgerdemannia flammicorona]
MLPRCIKAPGRDHLKRRSRRCVVAHHSVELCGSTSSIHTNPTAITGSHPSTDHNSEALQPLTIGSTSADSSHLPDTALLYPDPPLSASTFNLLYSTYGPLLNDGMDMEGVIGGPQRVMVKRNGELRFCQKCQAYKLDRAHHCGTCKNHCPWYICLSIECLCWFSLKSRLTGFPLPSLRADPPPPRINNCVGHHNQKAFYLFIVYGSIYCVFVAVTVVPPLLEVINVPMGVLQLDFNWAFLVMISGMFGLFLVPFTIFHTRQLLSNRTTIETYERAHYRMSERPRRAGPDNGVTTSKHLNVWDLGTKRNFMEVMGPEPKLWFIPINNSEGDGLTFPLNAYAYDVLDDEEDEERQMVVNIRAEDSGDDSDD